MKIIKTKFKDLYIIKKKKIIDNRGFFTREFCEKKLQKINFKIKQINFSSNKKKHTLRGFHYQVKPYDEAKILKCLSGKIYNVSIDLRKKSKTYLKQYSIYLSENDNKSLLVPKGFANCYLTLKNNTKILYFMSNFYKRKSSKSIRYNDKFFSVRWPIKPKVISKKDLNIKDFNG